MAEVSNASGARSVASWAESRRSQPQRKSGAQAILDAVLDHDVDTVFGLPGGQLDHLFDALHTASDRVRCINSRHEQGAAYMAFGYARSTGKPGVYTVVPGPGVLNTGAALCTAYACNAPVLCLTGQIPSDGIGTGRGYLHELPDQLATLSTLTKWADRIDRPADAPSAVREAFKHLQTGRPQPVSLEMAMDVMAAQEDVVDLPRETHPAAEPDPDAIAKAAEALSAAKRPLIYVGGGAIGAAAEITQIAELMQAPVTAFRSGRGVLSDRHPLSASYPVGYELWKDADVILAVGTRLMDPLMSWGADDTMTIVRIDIDPEELTRTRAPDVGVVGDARMALQALLPALERRIAPRPDRTDELGALKARIMADMRTHVGPQLAYLDVIRAALPDDGILVDEITQVGFVSWYGFPVYAPRQLITSGYQGTLGYGLATALGVKAAHPDHEVISISGDGGFMFNVQELATAVQYDLRVTFIVFNNNLYENVRRQQREWFGGRYIASALHNPDFAALAESFGMAGFRANSPETLATALSDAMKMDGPRLIEVAIGEMPTPWRYIIRERIRGGAAA